MDTAGISWGVTQARLDRASFSYHYRYLVKLARNLCEVSQCPKKAPTMAFSLLKALSHF